VNFRTSASIRFPSSALTESRMPGENGTKHLLLTLSFRSRGHRVHRACGDTEELTTWAEYGL
jgi:hypothetical protein